MKSWRDDTRQDQNKSGSWEVADGRTSNNDREKDNDYDYANAPDDNDRLCGDGTNLVVSAPPAITNETTGIEWLSCRDGRDCQLESEGTKRKNSKKDTLNDPLEGRVTRVERGRRARRACCLTCLLRYRGLATSIPVSEGLRGRSARFLGTTGQRGCKSAG